MLNYRYLIYKLYSWSLKKGDTPVANVILTISFVHYLQLFTIYLLLLKIFPCIASCIYEVPELNSYVDSVTKQVSFPEEFITTLNSVSISTTRGIAFSMFRGTFLHNAVLPIIDPSAFKKSLG